MEAVKTYHDLISHNIHLMEIVSNDKCNNFREELYPQLHETELNRDLCIYFWHSKHKEALFNFVKGFAYKIK